MPLFAAAALVAMLPCGVADSGSPLRGLPALPKPHFSYLPDTALLSDPAYEELLLDYIRVTGSLTPPPAGGPTYSPATMHRTVQLLAKAHAAAPPGARVPRLGLTFGCLPGMNVSMQQADGAWCDEACQAPALAEFQASVRNVSGEIARANAALGANISVGALIYDCETVEWAHPGDNYDSEADLPRFLQVATRAAELTYNTTRAAFPGALTVNYNLGGVWPPEMVPCWFPESVFRNGSCAKWNHAAARHKAVPSSIPEGWCARAAYTYQERYGPDVPYSVAMYNVNEPQITRDQLKYTSALAEVAGVAGGAVVPFVAIGAGWFRNSTTPLTEHICDDIFRPAAGRRRLQPQRQLQNLSMISPNYAGFSSEFDYNPSYSALLGAQINLKRFERSAFGPWERVPAAVFYPSPLGKFPSRGSPQSAGPLGLSAIGLKHLVAYVKGGTGLQ
eukprot:COSAG04_NODE_3628_length_2662_cov_1.405384_2_plen_448_part_00